jgi:hypothetical protein
MVELVVDFFISSYYIWNLFKLYYIKIMLDYLQRPKPEGNEDSFAFAPPMEPLHIRLAKKKGKVAESPSKN